MFSRRDLIQQSTRWWIALHSPSRVHAHVTVALYRCTRNDDMYCAYRPSKKTAALPSCAEHRPCLSRRGSGCSRATWLCPAAGGRRRPGPITTLDGAGALAGPPCGYNIGSAALSWRRRRLWHWWQTGVRCQASLLHARCLASNAQTAWCTCIAIQLAVCHKSVYICYAGVYTLRGNTHPNTIIYSFIRHLGSHKTPNNYTEKKEKNK